MARLPPGTVVRSDIIRSCSTRGRGTRPYDIDLLSDPSKIAQLAPESRLRAVRVQEVLAEAVENAGRLPLRGIVEYAWLALGGPAILAETHQRDDAETYFALLEQFETGGVIRDFSLLNKNLELLFAKPATEGDRIQIMTIHGAKGLEFDVVILPRLHGVPPRQDKDLLIWTSTPTELLIAAVPQSGEEDQEYKRVYDVLKKKQRQEDYRLLYVAMTRARNELHLFGSAKLTQKHVLQKAGDNTHLGVLWPHVKELFEQELRQHGRPTRQARLDTPPPRCCGDCLRVGELRTRNLPSFGRHRSAALRRLAQSHLRVGGRYRPLCRNGGPRIIQTSRRGIR